jgi:hypothetical protein
MKPQSLPHPSIMSHGLLLNEKPFCCIDVERRHTWLGIEHSFWQLDTFFPPFLTNYDARMKDHADQMNMTAKCWVGHSTNTQC